MTPRGAGSSPSPAGAREWILLMRAVNVGGHNRVPMPALRDALQAAGFLDVRTYGTSGNVIASSAHADRRAVAEATASLVREEFGVDSPVIARSIEEVVGALRDNPFRQAARERPRLLHVVFLQAPPEAQRTADLHGNELSRDSCRVVGSHLYVDYREGVHGSRLTPRWLARVLGVEGTARNWRTVESLREMAATT